MSHIGRSEEEDEIIQKLPRTFKILLQLEKEAEEELLRKLKEK